MTARRVKGGAVGRMRSQARETTTGNRILRNQEKPRQRILPHPTHRVEGGLVGGEALAEAHVRDLAPPLLRGGTRGGSKERARA